MRILQHIVIVLLAGGVIASCSSSQQSTQEFSAPQQEQSPQSNYYTTAFPHKDIHDKLKDAQQSVVRIASSGFYDSFTFEGRAITLPDIKTNALKDIATSKISTEESTSGTAIIIDRNNSSSLLISCEHTIAFPDTIITYYEGNNIPDETYIESISIKKNSSHLVYTSTELKPFKVLATAKRSDLALLSVEFERGNLELYPLEISAGNSNFLRLGSFMYILGFPKSYPIVTRGVASSSESWNDRFFVMDATFNPGISGGLVLATNDNYNSFEWVGMASSSTATREEVLVPHPEGENYSRITRPYTDSVFVQQKTRINYGITQAIPINQVKKILQENRDMLKQKGYRRALEMGE
ncbi:serine protease [Fodinibius sp. Rm-B-1B1-1]|uniref:S1 family peptidase n=1 Tax=Fodinibius alkaliphilus TaxID=3140241 RepID=UPI00315A214B